MLRRPLDRFSVILSYGVVALSRSRARSGIAEFPAIDVTTLDLDFLLFSSLSDDGVKTRHYDDDGRARIHTRDAVTHEKAMERGGT